MALLLYRLGKFSYRHRWLVVSLWLAVMVAVGGAAAAFHGTLSNNFQIPGTETQQMADKLKKELPSSSGGSASVVFEANDAQFSQAGKDAVSAALTELKTLPDVRGTVDPFATQAQLDKAAADLAAGKEQSAAGKARLETSAAELAAGKAQLDAAEQQMAAAGMPPAAIEARLGQQKAALAEGQAKLDAGTAGTGGRRGQAGPGRAPAGGLGGPPLRLRGRQGRHRAGPVQDLHQRARRPRSASRSRTSSARFPPPT